MVFAVHSFQKAAKDLQHDIDLAEHALAVKANATMDAFLKDQLTLLTNEVVPTASDKQAMDEMMEGVRELRTVMKELQDTVDQLRIVSK